MNEKLYINDTKEEFDVIIVGSGITGGWAAKEFCERGYKTLMVERGRVVEHRKDYTYEGVPLWKFDNRMKVDNLLLEQQYKVQSQCYAFNHATKAFFGNDRDLPYSSEEGTNFSWIRGNQVGGKSLTWHRQSYRMTPFDFEANKADGHGNDWPIRYKDLEKWYSHVEVHAGISGQKENLEQLPDSEFLPPFEMMTIEKDIKNKFAQNHPERPLIMGRTAHLTKPTQFHISQGRIQCQARSECQKGLGADFKNSLTKPGPWQFGLFAQGEMLPKFENQVALHATKKDKWGIPQLHFNVQWSDNERLMMEDAAETAANMIISAGGINVTSNVSIDGAPPGLAIHEVGTARMGSDPKDSVLNGFNQAHNIANLFVTDGSSYCSSGTVNPSLTFMALTVRAVDYCAKEMQNKRI